jgi:hypothetical protein
MWAVHMALFSLCSPNSRPMRRLSSHIPLIAALVAVCLTGQTVTIAMAATADSPSLNKAALNKAVQEALAKQTGGAGGSQAALGSGASSESLGTSESLSKLTNGGGEEEAEGTLTTSTASISAKSAISTSVLVPIFIVGAALLGGIAFFIVRDARSVAPAGDGLGGGSSRDQAARLRKRRAKAKAARRQRKRNR